MQLGLPRKRKRSFEFYRQPDQWMALAGLSGQLLEPKNDAEVDNLFKAREKRPDAR